MQPTCLVSSLPIVMSRLLDVRTLYDRVACTLLLAGRALTWQPTRRAREAHRRSRHAREARGAASPECQASGGCRNDKEPAGSRHPANRHASVAPHGQPVGRPSGQTRGPSHPSRRHPRCRRCRKRHRCAGMRAGCALLVLLQTW